MEATEQRIIDTFFRDGRLAIMPTRRGKLLVVLARLAESFEPGRSYPETEVNEILSTFHDDVAALRRYLVDDRFLARENGIYRRLDEPG
jgi:hypothetical protein